MVPLARTVAGPRQADRRAAYDETRWQHDPRDVHQPAALPASLLAYLSRWFNHIDLKANSELYVKMPAWLAGQLVPRPGASAAHDGSGPV